MTLALLGLAAVLCAALVLLFWAKGETRLEAEVVGPTHSVPAPTGVDRLRLLSWNIHYGAGPDPTTGRSASARQVRNNMDGIAAFLRTAGADIVALQEVDRRAFRSHGVDQLAAIRAAVELPYLCWIETWGARWVPFPGLNPLRHIGFVRTGQVVLSRFPILSALRLSLPQPRRRNRLIKALALRRAVQHMTIDVGRLQPLGLFHVHLEAYGSHNRMRQAEILRDRIRAAEHPCIVIGDLNALPTGASRLDRFADEPEADFRDDESYEILRGTPLNDALPTEAYVANEARYLTFPALAPSRKLDHILVSPQLRCEAFEALDEQVSDHRPIACDLVLPQTGSTPTLARGQV